MGSLKVKRSLNLITKTSLGARIPKGVIILDYSLPDMPVILDLEASGVAVKTDISQFQESFERVIVYMSKCVYYSLLSDVIK